MRRLKVSPIDELNDPFEYLALNVERQDVRRWAREFRKTASSGNGIISFSKTWKQPLLWAHYADSHQGVALGFDVPDRLLVEIEYIRKRIEPPSQFGGSDEDGRALIMKLLRSKHSEWSYEQEVRLLRPLKNCSEEGGHHFAPFNHVTELKEVVLGAKYVSAQNSQLQRELENNGITFPTARAQFTGFQMTAQSKRNLQKSL